MSRILYNVTCSVSLEIHEEWLHWMKHEHIPDVMETGMFDEFKLCRIKEYEENGLTYAVQYIAPSREKFEEYTKEFAPSLQQKHRLKYGESVLAFRTVLEILDEGHTNFPGLSAN